MSLLDDPQFIEWVEEFIRSRDLPPSIWDITAYVEARASVSLDKDETVAL